MGRRGESGGGIYALSMGIICSVSPWELISGLARENAEWSANWDCRIPEGASR